MGEQSATRLMGDRYQHLYSWYEMLRLLDEDSPYSEAWLEHPEAGAADDLTLHARPGSGIPTRFVQIKFHVDYRAQYSFETLLVGTAQSKPVLPGLFAAWRKLRHGSPSASSEAGEASPEPIEIRLVSNWHPAPQPDIGAFIGSGCVLLESFFTLTKRARAGQARTRWRDELSATDEEIQEFCRALRLQLSYGDLSQVDDQVDDRMGRYGLKLGPDARAVVRDEISRRIEEGGRRKRFTRVDLKAFIDSRNLRAAQPDEPPTRLWIHGWVKQGFDRQPDVELDWTPFFDRETRRIASPLEWSTTLLPALRQARDTLTSLEGGKSVDVRGRLPLTAALAVGAALPQVGGFSLRVEQPTGGVTNLWRSDVLPTVEELKVQHVEGSEGSDLVVGIAIVGNGLDALLQLRAERKFDAVAYLEPDSGTGNAVVRSAASAAALADSAKEHLRELKARFRARRLHLVLYTPAAFAVFLGQRLNALGSITTYERTSAGGYNESVTLLTG